MHIKNLLYSVPIYLWFICNNFEVFRHNYNYLYSYYIVYLVHKVKSHLYFVFQYNCHFVNQTKRIIYPVISLVGLIDMILAYQTTYLCLVFYLLMCQEIGLCRTFKSLCYGSRTAMFVFLKNFVFVSFFQFNRSLCIKTCRT